MKRDPGRSELFAFAVSAFGGPASLSASMALWSYPLTVFSIVWVGWAVAGPSLWWFAIATTVQVEMVALGWLARPVLMPLLHSRPRPVLMLVFWSAVGWLRGSTSSALVLWLGLQPAEQTGYRPIGGPIITVITVFFVAWAIDGNRRHRELMAELRGVGEALATSREHLGDLLMEERRRILGEVEEMIAGPIAELRELMAKGEGAAGQAAARINELIDGTVKPLSRQLAEEFQPWSPTTTVPRSGWWIRRARGAVVRRPLAPGLHAVTMTLMLPTVLAAEMPFGTAVATGLLAGAGVWGLLWVIEWLRRRLAWSPRLAGSTVLVVAAALIASAPVALGMEIAIPAGRGVRDYQISATAAMLVIGLGVLVINVTQQLRAEAEDQLRSSNAELAIEVARVSSQLWAQQNRIAQVLHGPVQGALIVAVARLSAVARGNAPMPAIPELLDPIDEALAGVSAASVDSADRAPKLEDFFGRLARVWAAVMQVDTRVTSKAARALDASPSTTALLVAIIRELANNAYRHGNSSQVQITVELDGAEAVRLQVVSNGPGPDEWSAAGLGSRLLDAAALEWRREAGPAGVEVWAVFPLRQQRGNLSTQALIATPREQS